MNKINYDKQLNAIIEQNILKGIKPKLLLHSCCAPCSSACILKLQSAFQITVFYYNPNIDNELEYYKRQDEQVKFCKNFGITVIENPFNPSEFYSLAKGLENLKEGGERCFKCYQLRLKKTAEFAKENGFDYFATTLTLSPLKNAEKLNEIGFNLQSEIGVKYLPSDFKKDGGYLKSIELSKEYNLYRQNYCGCSYSKR